ncbi:MAG: hypothetical protein AAGF11_50555 [Myxococcota bacterium]
MSHPYPKATTAIRPDRRLLRLQALCGLVFAVFVLLHLVNVMASAFGPGLYDAFQLQIRPIYQNPALELGVLFGSVLIHAVTGIVRIRRRPRTRDFGRLPRRTRLHRLSAYFLLIVIVGHIAATRLPSVIDGVWLGFAGLSFTMDRFGFIFYPYYLTLGLCGLYHGTYGTYLALRSLGVRLPAPAALGPGTRVSLGVTALLAALLVALGVLSFGGLLYEIEDPARSDFARFAAERFGVNP